MENIFKLKGEVLKEYHKKINLLAKYFNYTGYKWFWNIVTKESISLDDIEDILILERPHSFGGEDISYDEWEIYENIYNFFVETFYREIPKYYKVEEITTYNDDFPNNPHYVGYKISDGKRWLYFYDEYTGVAGCHWDTLAFEYWFEELN
ncbi:hypothetical protein [Thomasclavelia spiroformis]|uniref:hypothetical protein n=1 Tax=Thomasclavelia spiroformis TaxID=29348 RepID=UPI0024B090D0|nr:hypothetical protein [Thomasclavelia spiroformis]